MKKVNSPSKGGVTVEYLLVASALMLSVWYAFSGGPGDWRDIDRPTQSSALPMQQAPTVDSPGLVKTLNDRQHDFARQIYQP